MRRPWPGAAGAAATIGVGFGMGLPAFFMLPWKFLTALSSAAAWAALAFSAASASAFFLASALAGSMGGAGGSFAWAVNAMPSPAARASAMSSRLHGQSPVAGCAVPATTFSGRLPAFTSSYQYWWCSLAQVSST